MRSLYERFGSELRRRRVAAHMTLEELAERAGMTPSYLGTVERGKRDVSLTTIYALAGALEITARELLGGDEATGGSSAAALEAAALVDRMEPVDQAAALRLMRQVVTLHGERQSDPPARGEGPTGRTPRPKRVGS